MTNLHVAVGEVSKEWLKNVEQFQKKSFVRIGRFDLEMLGAFLDKLSDETCGDIELIMMADNMMASDGTKSGLLVAKYDDENYIALAGMTDP